MRGGGRDKKKKAALTEGYYGVLFAPQMLLFCCERDNAQSIETVLTAVSLLSMQCKHCYVSISTGLLAPFPRPVLGQVPEI